MFVVCLCVYDLISLSLSVSLSLLHSFSSYIIYKNFHFCHIPFFPFTQSAIRSNSVFVCVYVCVCVGMCVCVCVCLCVFV